MFSEAVNYSNGGENVLDQHQSKEIGRYITSNRKKNLVLHSLLHNRCKFCINSFSSTGCRNCCLPMCQEFTNVNTKKLLQNTVHNRNVTNRAYPNLKKVIRSVGHLGLNNCEPFLDTPHNNSSARLSPSLSARNVPIAAQPNSTAKSSSPVPGEASTNYEVQTDKMSLFEANTPAPDSQQSDSKLDLPSAPSPGLVLYNNEEQADLAFLVGQNDSQLWRFPAHSFILEDASSFFKALATTVKDNTETKEIRINWCEHDIFDMILKYAYTNEVAIKSVSEAMVLFNASNSFCLYNLSKLCLTFLYNQCNHENVLEVVAFFHNYLKHICEMNADNQPEKVCNEPAANEDLLDKLNHLIIRCYDIIDYYAQRIISSEGFFKLPYDLVGNILWRDTLNVASELEIFTAINQWSCQQCKKTCKELTDKNKRAILGELVFYPRYLTLGLDDFLKGPYTSEILTNEEKQILLEKIKGNDQVHLPKHMEIFKLDVERRFCENLDDDEDDDDDGSSTTNSLSDGKSTEKNNQKDSLPVNIQLKKKKKKKSKSKKILNGLGEVVLCVIKLLD